MGPGSCLFNKNTSNFVALGSPARHSITNTEYPVLLQAEKVAVYVTGEETKVQSE